VLAASVEEGRQAAAAEERLDHQRDAQHDEPPLHEAPNVPPRLRRCRSSRGAAASASSAGIFSHAMSRYASRREKYKSIARARDFLSQVRKKYKEKTWHLS
jgi:hypothetical protein